MGCGVREECPRERNLRLRVPRKLHRLKPDGNAYCIMGFIDEVMSKAYEATHEDERFNKEARAAYQKDATSGDYDHLRAVSQKILDLVND